MKTYKEVIAATAAIMLSGVVYAQSGSAGAEAEGDAQSEQGEASGEAAGAGTFSEDGATGAAAGSAQGEYTRPDGTTQQFSQNISTQTLVENPQDSFQQMDANADGLLEREEARSSQAVLSNFSESDTDGNEVISRSEFDSMIGEFEDEMGE